MIYKKCTSSAPKCTSSAPALEGGVVHFFSRGRRASAPGAPAKTTGKTSDVTQRCVAPASTCAVCAGVALFLVIRLSLTIHWCTWCTRGSTSGKKVHHPPLQCWCTAGALWCTAGALMISPSAPDTLLLGAWLADDRIAITATLRDWRDDVLPDVLSLAGEPWTTLVQAFAQAALMEARNVVVLSNSAALVRALSPPFEGPAPTRSERVWFGKGDWADIPGGGNADHWQVLRLIGGKWGGRFRAMRVDDLPKARELWQQEQRNK